MSTEPDNVSELLTIFDPPEPSPARVVFEYAASEVKRREIHVERCLSMALYWKRRTELAHERLLSALTLAEQAALACGKTPSDPDCVKLIPAETCGKSAPPCEILSQSNHKNSENFHE